MTEFTTATYDVRQTRISEAEGSALSAVLHLRLALEPTDSPLGMSEILVVASQQLNFAMYIELVYLFKTDQSTIEAMACVDISNYNKIVLPIKHADVSEYPFINHIVEQLGIKAWSTVVFNPQDDELTFFDAEKI